MVPVIGDGECTHSSTVYDFPFDNFFSFYGMSKFLLFGVQVLHHGPWVDVTEVNEKLKEQERPGVNVTDILPT